MISVIVPAYNAEKTIRECLDSLLDQTYKYECEVIVVDDGSTDSTSEIVSCYSEVKLIRQSNAGPAAARNKGVEEAKGEIVLFTDSDCILTPNWIEEMVKPFKENREIVGVKGVYKTRQEELIARFAQLEYEDKYEIMKNYKYIDFVDTYSAAFKRDIFIGAGGYDSTFPVACAEDVDFSYRLSKKGYKMVFNPDAVVYHIHPNTLASYLKKKYKFAYWRVLALKKNRSKAMKDSHTPQLMKIQAILPPIVLVAGIFSTFSEISFYILNALLLIYLLTMLPFTIKTTKKDLSLGLILPLILFLRSVAQSLGLIGGIIGSMRSTRC